mgnify:FL=1
MTRKITHNVAMIKHGLSDSITLGNLEAKRDWGFAGDYVKAMWMMLQQDVADDYVVGTGETHSVREFLETAFKAAGISDWQACIKQDPRFMRPAEVDLLLANPEKARAKLGWKPDVTFKELVEMMVKHDLEHVKTYHLK